MHKTLFDKTRGIKAPTKFSMCQHGVVLVDDFKPKDHCEACYPTDRDESFMVENMTPFENRGLGCITYGTRDAERIAKKRGLTPIGDTDFKTVAKSVWPNHPLTRSLK